MKTKKDLSLYIHIPFCMQKCKYCDFLSFSSTEEGRNSYLKELKRELVRKSQWAEQHQVISIFFGGGTPSILKGEQIYEIMDTIRSHFHMTKDTEITIEANPGTLSEEKLNWYQKSGINRLSMGLQSTKNEELKMLGRIHTYEELEHNYHLARSCGFSNINIDLMSALPGQTIESYRETLETVAVLEPEHISAYSLIVEEGTPLAEDDALLDRIPDEDTDRQMYQLTKELLKTYGYDRYEISNYAKEGFACRHNCVYWTGGDYLGFGLGASSYFEGRRFVNPSKMSQYTGECKPQDVEELSLKDQMEEFMFLGLRMTKGISEKEFFDKFGQKMEAVYGEILKKQAEEGLILRKNSQIQLTEKGLDVSNYVFCDYLIDYE